MKNAAFKIFSLLMILCYSLSIIGFDVHTCQGSGRSFVVSFLDGATCEDIHPEHECRHGACSGHQHDDGCAGLHAENICHDAESIDPTSCCSDDYRSLQLTGTLSADNNRHYDMACSGLAHDAGLSSVHDHGLTSFSKITKYGSSSGSGYGIKRDVQSVFSIWRI